MSEENEFPFPKEFISTEGPAAKINEDYTEQQGHAEKIAELEGVFEEFKSENSERVQGMPRSRIIINRFIQTLKELGFTEDSLQRVRLYHMLMGSSPIPGQPIDSLDVEDGLIEAFIKAKGEGFK